MCPWCCATRPRGPFDAAFVDSFNALLTEEAEVPGAGVLSIARDLFTWAELWRGRGAAAGRRFLSSAIVNLAARNHTGTQPNRLFDYPRELYGWPAAPAYLGLGLFLRREGTFRSPFGLTASPGTFGGMGAGSTVFWVDPARDLTFVCLTAGLMEEGRSIARFQRLSDLAIAAVTQCAAAHPSSRDPARCRGPFRPEPGEDQLRSPRMDIGSHGSGVEDRWPRQQNVASGATA